MPTVAITGHMNLTPPSADLVRSAITTALARYDPNELVGVSCIARGADSIFAQAVLDAGGTLTIVVPARNYRQTKVKPDHADLFDSLVASAAEVITLPYDEANRDAYEAANNVLLERADILFAVWDGQVGVDKGSTGSVVAAAREADLPVEVIWPNGASRA